jgi:ATP-dependent Clp protease protease subunit
MASVILASGTKGCRYAFPSSRIMVHQAGIDLFGGKLKDIEIVHREVQNWTDAMNKIFKKQTGKNLEELKKMIEYDNYMSANEAKKIGLIDKVQTKLI